MDQIIAQLSDYLTVVVGFLRRPEILAQLAFIIVLFLPAWFLSTRVEPTLEKKVRQISGMPGLLRVLAAFLRRLEWLFYVILLGAAYMATDVLGWPENNYLLYSVMLLSGAWLAINVVSHAIRSRLIGKLFALSSGRLLPRQCSGSLTTSRRHSTRSDSVSATFACRCCAFSRPSFLSATTRRTRTFLRSLGSAMWASRLGRGRRLRDLGSRVKPTLLRFWSWYLQRDQAVTSRQPTVAM